MSDRTEDGSGDTLTGKQDMPNKAQAEFDRYKARLGATYQPQPGMMLPWAVPGGGIPAWAVPGRGPGGPPGGSGPQPGGPAAVSTVTSQLGDTLRLGIELLNAALGAGASALSMGMGGLGGSRMYSSQHHGYGCGCPSCRPQLCGCPSCCETFSCQPCCAPGVHGCC